METARYGCSATAERFKEILTMDRRCRASTSRITLDETLKLLGVSMAATTSAETSIPDQEEELLHLSRQSMLLMDHQNNIKEGINKLEDQIGRIRLNLLESARLKNLSPSVVHFVELLHKANRYFDFKEHAMRIPDLQRASDSLRISHILLADRDLMSRFPSVDEPEVRKASHAIYWELYHRRLGNKYSSEPEKDPVLNDSIYNLVFQTREKGYDIHWDPMKELEKLMQSDQQFYDIQFCLPNLPVRCPEEQEESFQKAVYKYEKIVRSMHDKFTSTTRSSRKRPFETDHKFIATTRSSRKRSERDH